jgi:(2Fe-2S) ferredoxin
MEGKVKVVITRHAVERLMERRSTWYKKISGEVIANIIGSVICDGRCVRKNEEVDGASSQKSM